MSQGLMRSAGKAAAWSAMGSWVGLVGSTLSLVVLARLLDPTDFGIYGLLLVTLAIPEAITSESLNESLIQRPDLTGGHSNSVFGLSLLFAIAFFVGIFFAGPYIEDFFKQDGLNTYLSVMSIGLFLGAFTLVPAGHLQRRLEFKQIALVDVIGTVTAAIIGVVFAILLHNAWALIIMELSRRFVRMVAFCWFDRWWPSLRFSLRNMRDLAAYNFATVGVRLVSVIEISIPRAVVGIYLGPAALGMMNLALRVQEQAGAALISPFGAIALPFASMSQKNHELLHQLLRGAITVATFIAYPAFLGAVAIAPLAVPIVFGEKWVEAVAVIQISLLVGIRRPTATFDAGVLKGVGRPDLVFKIVLVCLLPLLALPVAAGHSLEAVMWLILIQKMVGWILGALAVQRVVGFRIQEQVYAGASALFASIIMAISIGLFSRNMPEDFTDITKLLALIGLGIVIYPLVLFIISPRTTYRRIAALALLLSGKKDRAMETIMDSSPEVDAEVTRAAET